jgi:predicted dehydrogenase
MSDSRPIRWGIIGTGNVAQHFARGLAFADNAPLAGVLSRNKANADAFAAAFGGAKAFDDPKQFLADDGIDAVYVATPNNRHAADAISVIDAGKAVLVEKPFALNADEARSVLDRAKERGVFCMEAMWMRFLPLVREAKRIADSGELGQITFLTADFSVPTTFNEGSHFVDPAKGGGALLDRGVYCLSLADYLLGEPIEAESFATRGPTGVDEQAAVTLRYPGGAVAQVWTSVTTAGTNTAILHGTKGKLTLHEPFYRPHRLSIDHVRPQTITAPGLPGGPSLKTKIKENKIVQKIGRKLQAALKGPAVDRIEPFAGNGYSFEADEVGRCVRLGLKESDVMPHSATLRIMRLMDDIRSQWHTT